MNSALIGILVLTLILTSGCVQPANSEEIIPTPSEGRNHGLFAQHAVVHGKTIEQTKTFFAESYGIQNEDAIFEKLPPLPDDMKTWIEYLSDGNGDGLNQIPYEVYIQPEFHPTFETIGKGMWVYASGMPATTMGIGTFPSDQNAFADAITTDAQTTLFIQGGWGVTHYQGVELYADVEGGTPIGITITPKTLLVGPTFPVISPEWNQPVRVNVIIPPTIENGTYTIHIRGKAPENALNQEWANLHSNYWGYDPMIGDPEGLATLTLFIQK